MERHIGRLRVAVLGAPSVRLDDEAVAFPTRKTLALFLYLTVEGGRHSREKLTTLFWPESDSERGRGSLRSALTLLRKALAAADPGATRFLVVERTGIGCGDNSLDLATLQAAYTMARAPGGQAPAQLVTRLQEAVALYRGDFLEGFSLDDAPSFDEWASLQRESWHRRMSAILDRLTRVLADGGEVQPALETTLRWVAVDPLNEVAHRRLIRLHLAVGDRAAALRAYEACRGTLAMELHADPAPETEALAARARSATPPRPGSRHRRSSAPATPTEPPLLGRLVEHGQLAAIFRAARRGATHVVTIEGEPGIGKTRLAAAFLQWAAAQGANVLRGRAFETGGRLPFGPLVEALRTCLADLPDPRRLLSEVWLAELTRLLPDLRDRMADLPAPLQQSEAEARTRLFEAIARLVQALAAREPLVLFIDDLHWADAASLDLLPYAFRRWTSARAPVLLVITLRSEDLGANATLGAWLADLGRDQPLTRLALGPLAPEDTARLVQALVIGGPGSDPGTEYSGEHDIAAQGQWPPLDSPALVPFTQWLIAQTAGHPFFVVETVRALAERGLLGAGGAEQWDLAGTVPDPAALLGFLAPRVREVVQARLARLSAPARQIITACAVLGNEVSFTPLAAIAGMEEDATLTALDELLTRRLLRESDAAYVFDHDKIREVAYAAAGAARRRVLHGRALEALDACSAPAAVLVRHALAAGLDGRACRLAMAAGDAAMRLFAVRDAIAHYEQARRLAQSLLAAGAMTNRDDPALDLHHLYTQLGRAYELTAQHQQAHDTYEIMLAAAQARSDAVGECQALNALATVASHVVDLDAAAAYLQRALAVAEAHGDTAAAVETTWNLGRLSFFRCDVAALRRYGERAVAQARQHGLREPLARSLAFMGLTRTVLGQWEQAIADATEAADLFRILGSRVMEADALVQLATARTRFGLPWAGVEAARTAWAINQQIDNPWGQADAARALGAALTDCGEYGQALAIAEAGLPNARNAGYPPMLIMILVFLGHLYLQIGALEEARQLYLEAQSIATHIHYPPLIEQSLAALCALAVVADDWAAAHQYALQALAVRDPAMMFDGLAFWRQTEALLHGGAGEAAAEEARRFGEFCGHNRRYRLVHLRSLAALAQHGGDGAGAIAHLREAAALAAAIGLPGELWQIEVALARALQACGEATAAAQARERATGIVQSLAVKLPDGPRRAAFLAMAEQQIVSL